MTDSSGLIEEPDVMVVMRDGVRLRTDLFYPTGEGPWPTLVNRYPYSPQNGVMASIARVVAGQGYAVVVQSCRGRYGSEGEFMIHHADVNDGYDTVEWAAQQPWSNGEVGMYGISYGGMTQWMAALSRPPHLVAIAPISSPWSWFGSGAWHYAPGVLSLGLTLLWSASMVPHEAQRRGRDCGLAGFVAAEEIQQGEGIVDPALWAKVCELQLQDARPLLDRRPLRDIEVFDEFAPWFRDVCDHPDPDDPYWQEISPADHLDRIDLPVFNLTGWYDYFTKAAVEAFATLWRNGVSEATRQGQRLVVGPWDHRSTVPRPDAADNAGVMIDPSPGSPMMRFFGHILKGEEPGYFDEPPIDLYVMGENVWRQENEWPLAQTEWTAYYLRSSSRANTISGDGLLSTEQPEDENPDSFVYDPRDPVPGPSVPGNTQGDAPNLNDIAHRDDVLVYLTPVLEEPVEVTGPVILELRASSSVANTDFTAKLIDVFPDGQAVPLCQGIIRTGMAMDNPVPGEVYRYEVDLWATSNVFGIGHRIRLDVSSSEYPIYELNPNTGQRITHDPTGETVPAVQHVYHDRHHASRLILPIIPR